MIHETIESIVHRRRLVGFSKFRLSMHWKHFKMLAISSQLFYGGLPARLWFRNHLLFWFILMMHASDWMGKDFITRIHNMRSIVPDVWWVGWGGVVAELNIFNSQLKITVKSFMLTESFFLFQFMISGEHLCEHFLIIITILLIKSPNPDSSERKEKNFPGRWIFRVQYLRFKLLQLKQIVYHRHVFTSFTFPPALREMENANCDLRKRNDHKSGLWCVIFMLSGADKFISTSLEYWRNFVWSEESSPESRPVKSGSVITLISVDMQNLIFSSFKKEVDEIASSLKNRISLSQGVATQKHST